MAINNPFPKGLAAGEFRRVMGCFATGVAIVTTLDRGVPRGLTVNSVTSVSLNPPLLLVCIDHSSETYKGFLSSQAFAVNVLSVHQVDLAKRFATKSEHKFSNLNHKGGVTGVPILEGIIAFIECTLEAQYPGGDHTIFVGRAIESRVFGGEPLLFYRGSTPLWSALHYPSPISMGGKDPSYKGSVEKDPKKARRRKCGSLSSGFRGSIPL